MAEQIVLTQPDGANPGVPAYSVSALNLDFDSKTIIVVLRSVDNKIRTETYNAQQGADQILSAFNKLTAQSLHRRILNRLIADGRLQGTIDGTPD